MNTRVWIKQLEKHHMAVGAERDKLRETISQMEELEECCSRAHDDLQNAIDALSELA